MNFRDLEYFVTVAESGNITRAAERLFISQQALSKQIREFEKQLGVVLFTRNPHFKLTYAGERLLVLAKDIRKSEERIEREMRDISENRMAKLRLGMTHTCGRALLPELLPTYGDLHPLVEFELFEDNSRNLEESLGEEKLDLILTYGPISLSNVNSYELLDEKLLLIAPNKLLNKVFEDKSTEFIENFKTNPDITALSGQPFLLLKEGDRIRNLIDEHMKRRGFTPNIRLETSNIETSFSLAEAGMGFAVYPELYMKKLHKKNTDQSEYQVFTFSDPDTVSTLIAAGMNKKEADLIETDFIEVCRKVVRN